MATRARADVDRGDGPVPIGAASPRLPAWVQHRALSSARARAGVTAVIPARNEEPTIGAVVECSLPYCEEVIVVDGHSTDATASIAAERGARVVLDRGRGKGAALRLGGELAGHPILVFLDADGSHDPSDIPRLVAPIQEARADLVIGSRGKGGSDELHGDPEKLLRLLGSDLILIGINWRWKTYLTDSQNGFRAIRKDVLLELGLTEDITTIEQEMTMKCLKRGYVVDEIPSHEYARLAGTSTIVLRKVWFRYVRSFLKEFLF